MKKEKGEKFHKFLILDTDGKEYIVDRKNINSPIFRKKSEVYGLLKIFVRNELQKNPPKEKPKHIEFMKKLELIDYCPESDVGCFKLMPNGVMIFDLIKDYSFNLARKWGAVKIQNPLLYRSSVEAIKKLQGEFHERDYTVNDDLVLRFASDPGALPFVQKVKFSYRQMPFKIYEEAVCFRREKRGELMGLRRLRCFNMLDQHAFCRDEKEGKMEFEKMSILFGKLMDDVIAKNMWVMGWEGTEDFYNKNKNWLKQIVKKTGVPSFFKLMKKSTHYFIIKNEYQAIGADEANVQVSTVQWDIKNGKRFNINYVGKDNRKHICEIILHAASFGSIERCLYGILEYAARLEKKGKNPILPLWLTPYQVRIAPVSEHHLNYAKEILEKIEKENIRVDIDDTNETVSKKILNSENDWVHYTLVIGEKEKESKQLTVRIRETKEVKKMKLTEFIGEIKEKTKNKPFRPLYVQKELSRRPVFIG